MLEAPGPPFIQIRVGVTSTRRSLKRENHLEIFFEMSRMCVFPTSMLHYLGNEDSHGILQHIIYICIHYYTYIHAMYFWVFNQ